MSNNEDSLKVLNMAQEMYDKVIAEGQEQKNRAFAEAERIIRLAEETANESLASIDKQVEEALAGAKEEAAKIERDSIEQAAIREATSRKEYEEARVNIDNLQRFESEYRAQLILLVSSAAQTLGLKVGEENGTHEISESIVTENTHDSSEEYVSSDFNYDYDDASYQEPETVVDSPVEVFENEGGGIAELLEDEEAKEDKDSSDK